MTVPGSQGVAAGRRSRQSVATCSGFALVKPAGLSTRVKTANRWGFVSSSRVRPVTAASLNKVNGCSRLLTKSTMSPSCRNVSRRVANGRSVTRALPAVMQRYGVAR